MLMSVLPTNIVILPQTDKNICRILYESMLVLNNPQLFLCRLLASL